MSLPIASVDELGLYLNVDLSASNSRAALILQLAHDLCETVVTPVPDTAKGVELAVAARAYNNVTSAHQMGIGSANISYGAQNSATGIGGLYLSRSDKQTLRRLAGRGGAFSVDLLPSGTNAVQWVTVSATAGTFTLDFGGAVTTPIAFNASAADVQAALEALGPIGDGNVSVAAGFVVTFVGFLATAPMPQLTADGSLLTGTVTTGEVTKGVYAAGKNLPPWDYDYYRSRNVLGYPVY